MSIERQAKLDIGYGNVYRDGTIVYQRQIGQNPRIRIGRPIGAIVLDRIKNIVRSGDDLQWFWIRRHIGRVIPRITETKRFTRLRVPQTYETLVEIARIGGAQGLPVQR